jgi:hypothetical protein
VNRAVRLGERVLQLAHERFGHERSAAGQPSEYDFVGGPLAAALLAFREFDRLSYGVVPAVRSYTVVDPFFGPVVFVGVLTSDGVVEITDFDDDPDYWAGIDQQRD